MKKIVLPGLILLVGLGVFLFLSGRKSVKHARFRVLVSEFDSIELEEDTLAKLSDTFFDSLESNPDTAIFVEFRRVKPFKGRGDIARKLGRPNTLIAWWNWYYPDIELRAIIGKLRAPEWLVLPDTIKFELSRDMPMDVAADIVLGVSVGIGALCFEKGDAKADSAASFAISKLENAVLGAESKPIWLVLGWLYLRDSLYELAAEAFLRAGNSFSSFCGLGEAFLRMGNPDIAFRAFDRAREMRPQDFHGWLGAGRALVEYELFDTARAYLSKTLELDSTLALACFSMGLSFHMEGKLDSAIAWYRMTSERRPKWPLPYFNAGLAYESMGEYFDAVDCYKKAIETDSTLSGAIRNLARTYLRMGKFEDAIRTYKKLIKLTHDTKDAFGLGMAYLFDGQYEAAESTFRRAIALNPKQVDSYLGIIRARMANNDFTGALDACREAIDSMPQEPRVYSELGSFYMQMGQYGAAAYRFEQALQFNPTLPEANANLAIAQFLNDDFESAIPQFKEAMTIMPRNPAIYNDIAALYIAIGDFRAALRYLNQAIKLNPKLAAAHYNLGWAYFGLGNIGRARLEFVKAANLAVDRQLEQAAMEALEAISVRPKSAEMPADLEHLEEGNTSASNLTDSLSSHFVQRTSP